MTRYSVATGPRGGLEFRRWSDERTFRTVSQFEAWPRLSDEDREAVERHKSAKRARAADDAAWRGIMRGVTS